MKISKDTELMFAQAVALSQSGRMKSTIHVKDNDLFIMNMDSTILIKFHSQDTFPEPFSFYANDYESPHFYTENGKIAFKTNAGDLERVKACALPKLTFEEIQNIWTGKVINKKWNLIFNRSVLGLLEDNLSHVEFHDPASIKLIQKDIYSGSTIEISYRAEGAFDFGNDENFKGSLPVGLRTADFKSLFSFTDELIFYFQEYGNFIYFEDRSGNFSGFIAACLYDELPYIAK